MVRKASKESQPSKKRKAKSRIDKVVSTAPIPTKPTQKQKDIEAFLKHAIKADPTTREGRAALRAAESAALRTARELRSQALKAAGSARTELERRANETYFRAVLARQLPQLVEVLRRKRPVFEEEPPPAAIALITPGAPTNVVAEAAVLSAIVSWTPPPGPVTTFIVTPFIGTLAKPPTLVPGTINQTTIVGLTAGTTYTFVVVASNPPPLGGDSPQSAPSNPVTILGLPVPPTDGGATEVTLPAFSSDPALLIDSLANPFRAWLSEPSRLGQKWRYEHLKIQAVAAARESMLYEEQIARLMAMAVNKLTTAEVMLNATMLQAVRGGQTIAGDLIKAATSPDLKSLLEPLGDTAAQSLLLPRFFAFLIETGPLKFWIGFFEAIICDLAAVFPLFGSATEFKRTRKYLRTIFNDPLNDVRKAVAAAAAELLARLDADIEQMLAPLRAATAEVIAGTRKAMADVFEGFDVTLLMTPAKNGGADVPDLDPLEDLYNRLNAPIDDLAGRLDQEIRPKLQQLIDGNLVDGDGNIFEKVVITFLAIPILAFLVISLAGGPFSAALLAAAVLLAAEELLRLLVQWLAGPLLKKIGELNKKLIGLVAQLQGFFAQQAALVRNESPELILRILASELRQLRDFLPQTFLNEAAALLSEARNVVLSTATQLGLAAEQSLGQENATAFETIKDDYTTGLEPAHQLPGGSDPLRLAGAALLRDFGRLEEHRIGIRDGKELEFTHRLSLQRLLGGNLAEFIQKRELVISLTEQDLIDRMFPGVYRALIKEVRATGVLGGTLDPRLCGIPLSITHLGESSTRIKRSANPAAPPIALPDCFPKTPNAFSAEVVGTPPKIGPIGDPFPDPIILFGPGGPDALEKQIQVALGTLQATIQDYFNAWFIALLLMLGGLIDDPEEFVCDIVRKPLLDLLPESLERIALEKSCGFVDPAPIVAAAVALIRNVRLADIMMPLMIPPDAAQRPNDIPNLDDGIPELAVRLQNGFTTSGGTPLPGLVKVARDAWALAVKNLYRRIARWGDVDFIEDPDPQVRALGFGRLVRRAPSETMVFNLFQPAVAIPPRADAIVGGSDGPPSTPASSLQYRLFENRGVEGDLLLRLETLDDDALLPISPTALVKQLSGNLTDVILDITFRGCYDADLGQTVRSSRRQTAVGFNVASRIPNALGPIALPDSLVRLDVGDSELRTVRYSMRAHRDKTLQVLTAAVAQPTPPASLLSLVSGKSVLGRDTAFVPLNPAITNFTFELNGQALPNTVAALQSLVGTLRISPADLGFDPNVLVTPNVAETSRLVSLAVAVIPMPDGVRSDADPLNADPIGIQLQVKGLLGDIFSGFATSGPLPDRLKMTGPVPGLVQPSIADLFSASVKPALVFGLSGALSEGSKLYDVVISMTFKVPKLRVRTAINALR